MNKTVRVLAVGDVVSAVGCEKLRELLPSLKKEKNIDVCIVNGENAAVGNGMTAFSCEHIFASGADVITGGNHTFKRREFYETLENSYSIVRPINYSEDCPGRGYTIVDKGFVRIGVVNVLGTIYMENLKNPFDCMDEAIKKLRDEVRQQLKKRRSDFTLTERFRRCTAHTLMFRRQMNRFCQTERAI